MGTSNLAFMGVATLFVITPGVDFATVVRSALKGRQQGMFTCVGVLCGFLIHTCIAVVGVSVVATTSSVVFNILKVLGGVFLVYLGVSTLVGLVRAIRSGATSAIPAENDSKARQTSDRTARYQSLAALRNGFFGNVFNPKAPVLWLSILPQFVPPGSAIVSHVVLLSAVLVAIGAVWFPVVVLLVNRFSRLFAQSPARRLLEGLTGVSLVGLGVGTLLTSH